MGRYISTELNLTALPDNKFQVITPSKAIASYLRVPHYSLESLTQNMVRLRGIRLASALLSRRLMQNAVREVIDTKDIEGTAKAFLPTVKDLLRNNIDLKQLQVASDLRIHQIGNLAIAYRHQLRQTKHIDAAELYWQGSTNISYQKTYTFYGYFAPEKGELAVIDAIAGQDSVLVLPLEDLYPQNQQAMTWLQSRGWEWLRDSSYFEQSRKSQGIGAVGGTKEQTVNQKLPQCFKQSSTLPAGVKLNVFPNLIEEVRGVLTQVKILQSQGVSTQDMVLATRDERLYGETLMDMAWEYNLPVQVCYEIPLEQTRLGSWLKLLLEVVSDNFPFEATARLLSHPLVKQMPLEIWSAARETHPQGLIAWQELGVDLNLLDFPNSCSRSVWLSHLFNILSSWEILENAKSWAREIVAYYRLQSGLKELSQSEALLNKTAFSNEISEILALLTIPAQPGRGGIDLHCLTSLWGTSYPYVFVLGCAEGILPQAIADDQILDFHSRKQLGKQGFNLPTAIDMAMKETFDFYCMLKVPTQQIIFSYPESIDCRPVIPSPYLSRLGLKPSPVRNLPLASIEQARQLYLRQPNLLPTDSKSWLISEIHHALQVESNRESAVAPDEYDGVIRVSIDSQDKIFSASQLIQLGQCPFKWFSARLLKLQELVEAESDLDAATRGNLYHRCLELSLVNIKTADDLAKFSKSQLAQAFAIAEQELKLTELTGWEAQRQEHLNLLSLNLAAAEFLPPEREVVATETKFEMQWHGLEIRGQVDRIDRTAAGLTVIDYKTSSTTPAGIKDSIGKANIDLQLAVYQDAIAKQYPGEVIDTAAYYSLTKQKTISRPKKDVTELATFAQQVKAHLQQGYYPVAPDIERKACRYCDYDLVCRQSDRLSRKGL